MKCEYCGKEINEDMHFCDNSVVCDDETDAAFISERANINIESTLNREFLTSAGFAVAGIIILLYAVYIIALALIPVKSGTILFLYDSNDDKTIVIADNKVMTVIDKKLMLSENINKNLYMAEASDNICYFITKAKVRKITDKIQDCVLSPEGNTAAYTDIKDTLYLYNIRSGKKTKIAENVEIFSIRISPDGKSVAYRASNKTYAYIKGKNEFIGDDLICVSISNSGRYLYLYSHKDGALFVSKGGKDKTKIADNIGRSIYFILNKDHTQIASSVEDKFCIYSEGKKIAEADTEIQLLPTVFRKNTGGHYSIKSILPFDNIKSPFEDIMLCDSNLESLCGNTYTGGWEKIIYINKKGEAKQITASCGFAFLDKKGKYLFFNKSRDLYKASVTGSSKPVKLADNIISFNITSDGKFVYYINSKAQLWFKKEGSEAIKIADKITAVSISSKDIAFFITENGTLYATKNGKAIKKIAKNVHHYEVTATSVYYFLKHNKTDTVCDLYASLGNTSFKLLKRDIEASSFYMF